MIRIVKLACFLLLIAGHVEAQQHCDTTTFQIRYWIENENVQSINKLLAMPNGSFILVSNVIDTGNYVKDFGDLCLICLSSKGTVQWSKRIGHAGSIESAIDAKVTADGGIIIAGATGESNPKSDAWLLKLDAQANIQWSTLFNPTEGDVASVAFSVIQLDDGSYVAAGALTTSFDYNNFPLSSDAIIVRVDKNGTFIWGKQFSGSKIYSGFSSLCQTSDGSIVVEGNSHSNGSVWDGVDVLAKIDKNTGQAIWSKAIDGQYIVSLHASANNHVRLSSRNVIADFDENGSNIKYQKFDLLTNSISDKEVIYLPAVLSKEDFYVIRREPYPVLFKLLNDSVVAWAKSYSFQPSFPRISEVDDAILTNNEFLIGTSISSIAFPDSTYGVSNTPYVIKTDALGNTTCSSNFTDPFTFTLLDLMPDNPYPLTEHRPLAQFAAGVYNKPLTPHGNVDCADISCCKDTVLYDKITLCEKASYHLPDGRATDSAGVYTSTFNRIGICDSVIFTTISEKKNIVANLGNDTCIVGKDPIVFLLTFPQEVKYLWQDGSSDSIFVAKSPGLYWVQVSSDCNVSRDSVIVLDRCNFPVYIPNAFTPNADGVNDFFRVTDLNGQSFVNLSIYNRYGQLLYFSSNLQPGWDGRVNGVLQPSGTYIYVLRYLDKGKYVRIQKGTVLLIR